MNAFYYLEKKIVENILKHIFVVCDRMVLKFS
ncbi:unnamed protein product [Dracunculus medinensis]|uniref:Transcriptional regulator n=1 Tax=Dracunculus medinensis TaxID=318479 RepID=A0A0N4UED7_DRAME|nr:unnamed protein product [Dracunculus medinensis]